MELEFLDLVRCFETGPFVIDFDTPGARFCHVSSRLRSERSPCGVELEFVELVRCSVSEPFAIDVDTPGIRCGSVSIRWLLKSLRSFC